MLSSPGLRWAGLNSVPMECAVGIRATCVTSLYGMPRTSAAASSLKAADSGPVDQQRIVGARTCLQRSRSLECLVLRHLRMLACMYDISATSRGELACVFVGLVVERFDRTVYFSTRVVAYVRLTISNPRYRLRGERRGRTTATSRKNRNFDRSGAATEA